MLYLLLSIDNNFYAFDIANIIEIVPLVTIKPLPWAPDYIPGVFNYRGSIVPVIDLTWLISGKPSSELLSTRIVVVNFKSYDGSERKVGLITEHATETESIDVDEFQEYGFNDKVPAYLGGIAIKENIMYQRILISNLLTSDIQRNLFLKE